MADIAVPFLLVADDRIPIGFVEPLVRSARYRALGRADSPGAAVDITRARRVDLVIADVASLDQLHRLADAVPRLGEAKVVVATALPPELALLGALAGGVHGFVSKPVTADVLQAAASAVLAGHTYVDPRCTCLLVELALYGQRSRPRTGLTFRQAQVVRLAGTGLTNAEIATALRVSVNTVKSHLQEAMRKLGAGDRFVATALAEGPVREVAATDAANEDLIRRTEDRP